jgi:prepilin-type N-terminal cleavage/methylation domain-containing protein
MAPPPRTGFSLIEVVVAVGIFAVAISIVIGLLVPTVNSVNNTIDTNTANRLSSAINAKLQSLGYSGVQPLLYTASTNPNTVSLTDANLLFASKTGEQVGTSTDPVWGGTTNNAAKYFEIMLVHTPNAVLSAPDSSPATSAISFVMFTVRVTWPAYLPDSSGLQTTVNPPTPRAQRSVFVFNAAIAR